MSTVSSEEVWESGGWRPPGKKGSPSMVQCTAVGARMGLDFTLYVCVGEEMWEAHLREL